MRHCERRTDGTYNISSANGLTPEEDSVPKKCRKAAFETYWNSKEKETSPVPE
jgi:hypothetical protein